MSETIDRFRVGAYFMRYIRAKDNRLLWQRQAAQFRLERPTSYERVDGGRGYTSYVVLCHCLWDDEYKVVGFPATCAGEILSWEPHKGLRTIEAKTFEAALSIGGFRLKNKIGEMYGKS